MPDARSDGALRRRLRPWFRLLLVGVGALVLSFAARRYGAGTGRGPVVALLSDGGLLLVGVGLLGLLGAAVFTAVLYVLERRDR
ncbi:hypothetical protein [Pseudonocardia sp. ICBG1293]|uniref:hypothetical protein n=1 Tax=Pseudonocardia sp. ICBG1293 TaxID=2844382 RepID=UPI001CCC2779|nr:hypothetical protein [Pseudonocardia sp. ICBG1293]